MGFFSDLKEDLSQAVNELMPEEEQNAEGNAERNGESVKPPQTVAEADQGRLSGIQETAEAVKEEAEPVHTQSLYTQPGQGEAALESGTSGEQNKEPDSQEMDLESVVEKALAPDTEMEEQAEEGAENRMDTYERKSVSDETSIITAGMTISGDITSEGSLNVVGNIIGNIDILGKLNVTGYITGNSKAAEIYAESAKINGEIVSEGAVKIGASSVVIGNITATSASIAGAVKGDIDVKGPVILDASAIVMGNIKSKSVQINNGAVIEGMCSQCYADVSPSSFFKDYKMEGKKQK